MSALDVIFLFINYDLPLPFGQPFSDQLYCFGVGKRSVLFVCFSVLHVEYLGSQKVAFFDIKCGGKLRSVASWQTLCSVFAMDWGFARQF